MHVAENIISSKEHTSSANNLTSKNSTIENQQEKTLESSINNFDNSNITSESTNSNTDFNSGNVSNEEQSPSPSTQNILGTDLAEEQFSMDDENEEASIEVPLELIENNPSIITSEKVRYPSLTHLDMLPLASFSFTGERTFDSPRINRRSNIECYNYGKKKIPVYFEAYTGLDFVNPSYSVAPENQSYLTEREESQSVKVSYNAGAQFKFLFDNGLYLKAGVDYSQYRERFTYNKTTIIDTILPNQPVEINITTLPDGRLDTMIILGNAPATIIESKNWRVGNDYREIGLSALAGYQIENNNSFIAIESGVLYNLWFDFDGMLLDASNNPTMVSDYFKSRNNLTLLAGLKYGYRMTDRLALLAGLNYRSNLSDINSANNLVNQRNSRIGVSAGVEIKLW